MGLIPSNGWSSAIYSGCSLYLLSWSEIHIIPNKVVVKRNVEMVNNRITKRTRDTFDHLVQFIERDMEGDLNRSHAFRLDEYFLPQFSNALWDEIHQYFARRRICITCHFDKKFIDRNTVVCDVYGRTVLLAIIHYDLIGKVPKRDHLWGFAIPRA